MTTPRLLSKSEAAAYCGLKSSRFSSWVKEGIIPPSLPGTYKWDRKALDQHLDKISGIEQPKELSPLEEWRAKRNARRA